MTVFAFHTSRRYQTEPQVASVKGLPGSVILIDGASVIAGTAEVVKRSMLDINGFYVSASAIQRSVRSG